MKPWVSMRRNGGRCITPRLGFNYIVLFIPSLTRKLLFIDNIRRIIIELDEEYIGYLNIGPCV